MKKVNLNDYDFVDFGASKGSSLRWATKKLGGQRGLGIDRSSKKVAAMQEAGWPCAQADIANMTVDGTVRFTIMNHFLEHLPGYETAFSVLKKAKEISEDFFYIRGPCFDDDEYLRSLGLKWFYSDWTGHTYHLTSRDLNQMLDDLGLFDRYLVRFWEARSSQHAELHPLESPKNQRHYDATVHPPKSDVTFDRNVYSQFVCYVRLRPFADWPRLLSALNHRINERV